MPLIEFPGFCDGMYQEATALLDAQVCLNLVPVPGGPHSKSKTALYGRPGLSPFANLGQSPARALWAGDNRLFAVAGTHFYEVGAGGSILTDYGNMTGSSGVGPCQIEANGTQLLVMDSGATQIYFANPSVPIMSPVQVVNASGTSVGPMGAVALAYLDGYYVALADAATCTLVQGAAANPNMLMVSKYGDGTQWPVLSYVIRTGSADLTTNLCVLNGQLWVFGQKTIDVWYNAGNPTFPFARIQGSPLNFGLMWPYSVVKYENAIVWAGADDRGYVKLYKSQGLQAQRVSTFPIERRLGNWVASGWLVTAYGYQEDGHSFYCLTLFDNSNVPQDQIVLDLTTGLFHERGYAGAFPVAMASVPGFNAFGPNFVADGTSGKIFFQGNGFPSDAGTAITYQRAAPHLSTLDEWTRYSSLQVDADIGTAQIVLSYSNDGGKTFNTGRAALGGSTESATTSDAPTRQRFKWWQLGRSRDRVFQISITDSQNKIRIVNAYLNASGGSEGKAA